MIRIKNTPKLFCVIVLAFAVFSLSACKEEGVTQDDAPSWWPQEISFPPDKPEKYEGKKWQGSWPPAKDDPRVQSIDFWSKVLRHVNVGDEEADKSHNPREALSDGFSGHQKFVMSLGHAGDRINPEQGVPPCGMFRLELMRTQVVNACDPYPSDVLADICDKVQDAKVAATSCRYFCSGRYGKTRISECTSAQSYNFSPLVEWKCQGERVIAEKAVPAEVACRAHYLCECK